MKVADEVWVGVASLHRENPERTSFSAGEILDRLAAERAHPELRPGVKTHISQHAVANVPPNSGKYRMLYRMPDKTYRLFRPGDNFDPKRKGGKNKPERSGLPPRYHNLLDWYEKTYCTSGPQGEDDPVLQLLGLGKEIWEGVDPDAYVADLRAGWDADPVSRD